MSGGRMSGGRMSGGRLSGGLMSGGLMSAHRISCMTNKYRISKCLLILDDISLLYIVYQMVTNSVTYNGK